MNELIKSKVDVIKWKVQISGNCLCTQESSSFQIQDSKCNFLLHTGFDGVKRKPLSLWIIFDKEKKFNPPVAITVRVILPSDTFAFEMHITCERQQKIWSSFDYKLRGSSVTFEMIMHDTVMKGIDESVKCFSCKESLETEFISLHTKCTDRQMKCSDCSSVFLLKDWLHGHECEKKKEEDAGSLSEDFKKMLQDGISHDLILKVGDKEIRAHKDVLRARSQVFESMFEHDMKEKNSGVIDVPDCDPQAMEVFLSYVYCGKADALNANNMLHLYYIADKYQMIDLKNECSSFIKRSLSPTNLCDVIQLALNHSDTGLLNVATEYFNNNMLDVLQTVEWQSFLKDNSTVANELLIKFHKNKK